MSLTPGTRHGVWPSTKKGTADPPSTHARFASANVPGLDQVCDGVLHNGSKRGRIQITRVGDSLGVDGDLAI